MKLLPAAALALFAAVPALASTPVLVDFERNWDYANGDVDGYYAGGTAADGTTGPVDLGVSFVGVSGLSNDASFTYYSGAPSMLGTAYVHTFSDGDKALMNVSNGADTALSFYYSSPSAVTGAVRAFSGLNGTGTLLGTFNLVANDSLGVGGSFAYNVWTPVSFAFTGVARSFDLTGSANLVGIDNVRVNVSPVPEPDTVLLMLAGGAALLRTALRRRRS